MLERLSQRRLGFVVLAYAWFCGITLGTRIALTLFAWTDLDSSWIELLRSLAIGAAYDVAAAAYWTVPITIYLLLIPERWFRSRIQSRLTALFLFAWGSALASIAVSEFFFWEEFGVRFNFIAVDYLIYTREVIENIGQSYPVIPIFSTLFACVGLATWVAVRTKWIQRWSQGGDTIRLRSAWAAGLLLVAAVLHIAVDSRSMPHFGNSFNRELARNGSYGFVAAFRNNQLSYSEFYPEVGVEDGFLRVRKMLSGSNVRFLGDDPDDLIRQVSYPGPEKRLNVVQITVESLSAEYMGVFGNPEGLTPHLDALTTESLFFTNFHAVGTRTVRGMEALSLSIPPTPGRSIVKRPDNDGLFSLGSVFRSRGYETGFFYGGYGYFDNMNAFFEGNGFRITDRAAVEDADVSFSNAWGACDEDVYDWALADADRSYAAGEPFFQFIMTTSNHRPYTYPEGRIDIPSHTGRSGAVKYTDFAIAKFLEQAKQKPWFEDTIFVIVADHCATSSGKTELPIHKYEIPLIVYSPAHVEPRKIETLTSQVDYAPTLLGLLNWTYTSRFFGRDVLRDPQSDPRAFIGTYQRLGYMNGEDIAILSPLQRSEVYHHGGDSRGDFRAVENPELVLDAIALYQSAAYLYENGRYVELEATTARLGNHETSLVSQVPLAPQSGSARSLAHE